MVISGYNYCQVTGCSAIVIDADRCWACEEHGCDADAGCDLMLVSIYWED